MPKIALTEREKKEKNIKAIITSRCAFYDYKIPELAERAGLNYATLNRRLKYPLNLTVDEIDKLDRVLHFSKEDKEKLW